MHSTNDFTMLPLKDPLRYLTIIEADRGHADYILRTRAHESRLNHNRNRHHWHSTNEPEHDETSSDYPREYD